MSKPDIYKHYAACHTITHEHYGYLTGRILTIIDAIGLAPTQLKAVKDLVRGEFTDVWVNMIRDSILIGFKHAAKEAGDDDWGDTPYPDTPASEPKNN